QIRAAENDSAHISIAEIGLREIGRACKAIAVAKARIRKASGKQIGVIEIAGLEIRLGKIGGLVLALAAERGTDEADTARDRTGAMRVRHQRALKRRLRQVRLPEIDDGHLGTVEVGARERWPLRSSPRPASRR